MRSRQDVLCGKYTKKKGRAVLWDRLATETSHHDDGGKAIGVKGN